jgi:hypothetical protein
MLVARGDIVHLTVPSMADCWGPDIVYIPVVDTSDPRRRHIGIDRLVWLRHNTDNKIRELARITRETLGTSATT